MLNLVYSKESKPQNAEFGLFGLFQRKSASKCWIWFIPKKVSLKMLNLVYLVYSKESQLQILNSDIIILKTFTHADKCLLR